MVLRCKGDAKQFLTNPYLYILILGSASKKTVNIFVNQMDNQLLAPRMHLSHYRYSNIHGHYTYIVPYKKIGIMCIYCPIFCKCHPVINVIAIKNFLVTWQSLSNMFFFLCAPCLFFDAILWGPSINIVNARTIAIIIHYLTPVYPVPLR